MIKVHFKTNLDLINPDEHNWPEQLPFRPQVKDYIRSSYVHPGRLNSDPTSEGFNKEIVGKGWQLELKVVAVTIVAPDKEEWGRGHFSHLEVELHLPEHRWPTLRDFYNWYEKITGRKFI